MKKTITIFLVLVMFLFASCSTSNIAVTPSNINIKTQVEKEIEAGNYYGFHQEFTLATGESNEFIICPQTKEVNFKSFEIIGSDSTIELFENVTYNGGTLINGENMNRNYNTLDSDMNIYLNSTITNTGKKLFTSHNLILNQDICYLLKITNNIVGDNVMSASLFWLEE